ncbi:3-hydroxyacyl-CoA dehydrogenase family protein [Candidatus Poribacteria bacterium]|nr:3-hydroxyacyl-CoA dehydrogenase family protein [Candidatus Poribacteria bacterium]
MVKPEDVKRVAVIGAGLMGHSIAQVFAQAGIEVALVATREKSLERAMSMINRNLNTLAEFGKVKKGDIPAILRRIHPTTELASAACGADFVLETVTEDADVKKRIFSELNEACSEDTILSSNTSSLNIFEIAEVRNPGRLVICHWVMPAHIFRLVDVIPGPPTSPEVVAFTAKLVERLGKRPVVMKKYVPAAIINQIQNGIGMAVSNMLENEWAAPEDIDLAVKLSLGVRLPILGVVQTLDFTGLDTVYKVMQSFGISNRLIEEKVNQGHLGTKTSKGIYDYGGRSEEEILKRRDELCLKLMDFLDGLTSFKPV